MEINLSTAETYIVNYLQNSGQDDGDWDTYGAAKDLRDICDMNRYTDYEQVPPTSSPNCSRNTHSKPNHSPVRKGGAPLAKGTIMEDTITLAQYVTFLKETLDQLDEVAKDSPDIELKDYTPQIAIYPNSREDALDLLYLARIEPTFYKSIVRGQFNTVNGISYVHYDEEIAGEDK